MANKKAINLQLNIDTQFQNVEAAVNKFKTALAAVKIDPFGNFNNTNSLAKNFQAQAEAIQDTLGKIGSFDFKTGTTKEYAELVASVNDKFKQLTTSINDYKVSLRNSSQAENAAITQKQEENAAIKSQVETLKEQKTALQEGRKLYIDQTKNGRQLTEQEAILAQNWKNSTVTITSLNAQIKSLNKQHRENNAKIKEAKESQRNYNSVLNVAEATEANLGNAIKSTTAARKEDYTATKAQVEAEKAKINIEAIQKDTNSKIEEYSRISNGASESTQNLTAAIESQIVKWGSFRLLVRAASSSITDLISTYQELDDNLSAISAVSGIPTNSLWSDMPSMIDDANKLALSIGDLTNGMLLFYQQGLSTEETEIRLNAAGKMAAISQQDLSSAVDQLTSAMNAFGFEGEDASRVVDVYAKLAGKTAVNVEELAQAMSRTASIAKNAGMSFEQTTAFIATMEETTRLSAETIGNSLKSIVARFQKLKVDPSALLEDGVSANDVEKALNSAGIKLRDLNGEFRDIGDVIMELSSKWDSLDTNTQKYVATMAAGTQQASNFIALVSNYDSNIQNLAYAMDATGAANQQFQAVSNNLSASLNKLNNNLTALKTSFIENASVISGIINLFASFVGVLAKVPAPIKEAAIVLTGYSVIMTKINLLRQKRIFDSATEIAATVSETAAILAKGKADDKETKALYDNLMATVELAAAKKKLTRAETDNLKAQALNTLGYDSQTKTFKAISGAAEATGGEFLNLTSKSQGLKQAFVSSFTKMKDAAAGLGTVIKALPLGISVMGAALMAVVGVGFIYNRVLESQTKAINENIETLKEQQNTLKEESATLENSANSLKDYSSRLREAKKNGQDLTSIREEIIKNFGDEKEIVIATKGSYDDLQDAIQKVIDKKEELAKQKAYQELVTENKSNQAQADRLKGAYNKSGFGNSWNQYFKVGLSNTPETRMVDSAGNLIDKETEINQRGEYFRKNPNATESDFQKEMGYTAELRYTLRSGDEILLQDGTQQEYEDLLKSSAERFYSSDEVQLVLDQTGASKDGMSQEDYSRLLSLTTQVSPEVSLLDANGKLTKEVQDLADSNEQLIQTLMSKTGASFNEAIAFLEGNYKSLSAEALYNLSQANESLVSEYTDKESNVLTYAADNFKKSFDEAFANLKDEGIISENDAKTLGLNATQQISQVFASSGKDVAKEFAKILQDDFAVELGSIKIPTESADELSDKLKNVLGSAFDNIDISDFRNTVQTLIQQFSTGTIDSSQLLTSLQYLASSSNEANSALSSIIPTIQQVTAANSDSFSTMEKVSGVWTDFGNNLKLVQNLTNETGISLEELQTLAEAMGTTTEEIIASGNLKQIGSQFFADSETAKEFAQSLVGATDAELDQALAEQEAAKSKAEASAMELESRAKEIEAIADKVEAGDIEQEAAGNWIDQNHQLVLSADEVSEATKQVAEQFGEVTPGIQKTTIFSRGLTENNKKLAAGLRDYAKNLRAQSEEEKKAAKEATGKILYIKNLKNSLKEASNNWQTYGRDADKGASSSKNASDAVKQATEALEKEKSALQETQKALQDQKTALDNLNKSLQDNLKLYIELVKSKLSDEINNQSTRVKAYYDAIKDAVEDEIDAFNGQLDELSKRADQLQDEASKQQDSLNKLYDAAVAYYEAAANGIDNEIEKYDQIINFNEERINLLEEQKDGIQAQIDALDDAADSESKLLALEKARDALENARNQKTRMVLTNGGGWRLKTDRSAVESAQSNLAQAEKDYQKEILERQQKEIESQTDEISKQNDNLESIKNDLESQKETLEDIKEQWGAAQSAIEKTTSELEEQTELIKKFQEGTDLSRQEDLSKFIEDIKKANELNQNASDASNISADQSNADKDGSIANAIEKLQQQQNLADEYYKKYFENQLSNNAVSAEIQAQVKDLIMQMVNGQTGEIENFANFQATIDQILERANSDAQTSADYINQINEAISRYDEWSNQMGMTTDEINQRQQIINDINNATLGSLLEGGSTFGQLQGQYEEIIRNNDETVRIQGQIDAVNEQINEVQAAIDAAKEAANENSNKQQQTSNANTRSVNSQTTKTGNQISKQVSESGVDLIHLLTNFRTQVATDDAAQISNLATMRSLTESIKNAVESIKNNGISAHVSGRSRGGLVGFSSGGVDDFTSLVQVHGTKSRPELVLNNSQSAALFKYIDSMTRIPTFSSAGSAKNALAAFGTSTNQNNVGTSFANCDFNIESNADNIDSLIQDIKQSVSIRR